MSILSSLYHGEIHDKPNDVHNVPQAGRTDDDASGTALSEVRQASGNASGSTGPGGVRQTSGKGGWMNVSLADDSAMDAQLADVHAVALSDTFEHADAAPRRTQKSTGGYAAYQSTSERTGGSAASRRTQKSTDGSAVLPRHAERRIKALQDGDLRPPLYYTAQEQTPCANGVWESAHTVASKLESKEEFPQG